MPRNDLIQLRRDTAANWTSVNPILAVGEQGFETDTGKFKIGTGSITWNSLLYATDASDITGTTLAVTDDITCGGFSLPRGIMSFTSVTASDYSIQIAEETQVTGASFTAVANRYYKITYFEPSLTQISSYDVKTAVGRIRLTDINGAIQQTAKSWLYVTNEDMLCVAITTLPAGTVNLVGTLQVEGPPVTMVATRSATQYAFLLVEDIGAVSDNNNN
jgi:hypothetical protein